MTSVATSAAADHCRHRRERLFYAMDPDKRRNNRRRPPHPDYAPLDTHVLACSVRSPKRSKFNHHRHTCLFFCQDMGVGVLHGQAAPKRFFFSEQQCVAR
jgi:hypothetical protein